MADWSWSWHKPSGVEAGDHWSIDVRWTDEGDANAFQITTTHHAGGLLGGQNAEMAQLIISVPHFEMRRLKAFLDATLPEYADDGTRRD